MRTPQEPSLQFQDDEWIRVAASIIHGKGVFARWIIPEETPIIQYRGTQISCAEGCKLLEQGNPYIFNLNDEFDLDGNAPENLARFINHSCRPNCESRQDGDEIWIYNLTVIAPGEELTMNYGFGIQDFAKHPCRCGEEECVGFVVAEEYYETLRRIKLEATRP